MAAKNSREESTATFRSVKEIKSGENSKVVCSLMLSSDGRVAADIRTHLNFGEGKFSGPTKKGVNFPVEHIDEVIAGLQIIKTQSQSLVAPVAQ